MDIEDVKDLVRLEKELEQLTSETRKEAQSIIDKAKEKAQRVLSAAQNQKYYDVIWESKRKEIENKKRILENETEQKIKRIRDIAGINLEETLKFILKSLLGE